MSRMPFKKKKKKKRKSLAEKMSTMHTVHGEFVDTEAMPEGNHGYKAKFQETREEMESQAEELRANYRKFYQNRMLAGNRSTEWINNSWEKEFMRASLNEAVQREDLPEPYAGKKIPLLNTMSVGELERLEDNARIMVRVTRHSLGRPQHFLCCLIRQANGRIFVRRLSNGRTLKVYRTDAHGNHIDPTSFSSEAEIIKFIRKRKHIM